MKAKHFRLQLHQACWGWKDFAPNDRSPPLRRRVRAFIDAIRFFLNGSFNFLCKFFVDTAEVRIRSEFGNVPTIVHVIDQVNGVLIAP